MFKAIGIIKKIFRGENWLTINQTATKWNEQFTKGKWDFLFSNPANQSHIGLITSLCQQFSQDKKMKMLDVGCGNGALTKFLSTMDNCDYSGMDISSAAIDQLKKICPTVSLYCADAHQPPDFADQFDIIIFSEFLYYADFKKIIPLYQKFLAPGGLVIISMYDTWRTKIIWRLTKKYLTYQATYKIRHYAKKVNWTVKIARYHEPNY